MTDTPKTTLAEVLRCAVRWPKMMSPSAENAYLDAANMAEQHEARWSAERAKLVEELEAFRALAKRAVARLKVLRECGMVPADLEIELAKLAPKENAP